MGRGGLCAHWGLCLCLCCWLALSPPPHLRVDHLGFVHLTSVASSALWLPHLSVNPFIAQSRMLIENLELCVFSHAGQGEIVLIKIWVFKQTVLQGDRFPYLNSTLCFVWFLFWTFYALSHSVSIFFCLRLDNLSYVAPSPSLSSPLYSCLLLSHLSSPLPPRMEVVLLRFFLFFRVVDGWRGVLAVRRGGKKGQ